MMVAHQTIDRTKAASQFKGIDEIRFAGNGDLYDVVVHEFGPCAKRETGGAMAHEVEKAASPKPADKDQFGRFNH